MTLDRIGKSVTSRSKTESTSYLWDINYGLPQVLTESDGKGTALYSYGLGRISMADPRKGQMYYQYDGLGSVRGLTDRKGMTRGLYAYDAFGNPLISASLVDNDFQYTGEQVDDETGLIYLRSRYYDPEIGRFISRDSFAGFDTAPQSLNRYTYVQNNPVVYADPSGKIAPAVLAIAGVAARAAAIGGAIGLGSQYLNDLQANWAAGKTGMDLIRPSSSLETYGVSIGGNALTVGGAVGMFSATGGMGAMSIIAQPVAAYTVGLVGFSGTDLAKNYVNGKPLDVTSAIRQGSFQATGVTYPASPTQIMQNSALQNLGLFASKTPAALSVYPGTDATYQFMQKYSSGGAQQANVGKL